MTSVGYELLAFLLAAFACGGLAMASWKRTRAGQRAFATAGYTPAHADVVDDDEELEDDDAVDEEVATLQAELGRLKSALEKATATSLERERQATDLQKALTAATTRGAEADAARQAHDARIAELEIELTSARAAASRADEVGALESRVAQLGRDLEGARAELTEKVRESERRAKDAAAAASRLGELTRMQEAAQERERELASLRQELKTKQEQRDRLTQAEDRAESLRLRVEQLETEQQTLQARIDARDGEARDLANQLEAALAAHARARAERDDHERRRALDVEALEAARGAAHAQVDTLAAQVGGLSQQLEATTEHLQAASERLEAATKRVFALERQDADRLQALSQAEGLVRSAEQAAEAAREETQIALQLASESADREVALQAELVTLRSESSRRCEAAELSRRDAETARAAAEAALVAAGQEQARASEQHAEALRLSREMIERTQMALEQLQTETNAQEAMRHALSARVTELELERARLQEGLAVATPRRLRRQPPPDLLDGVGAVSTPPDVETASATGIDGVSSGPVDDLTAIPGIGPALARTLNDLGVVSFRQIATWSTDDIARIGGQLGSLRGRIARDGWVGGARREHFNKYGQTL